MLHVMIDGEKAVEITPIVHEDPREGRLVVLSFLDTSRILEEWTKLAPARRDYRWANDADDNEPSDIMIAEATRNSIGNPMLLLETAEPYWNGVDTLNQYPLKELSAAMGDALEWGEAIGEGAL